MVVVLVAPLFEKQEKKETPEIRKNSGVFILPKYAKNSKSRPTLAEQNQGESTDFFKAFNKRIYLICWIGH